MAEEELMFALRKKMDGDQIFGPRYAHMRPQIRMRIDFLFSNINLPKTGLTVESAADWTFLDATERQLLIDNPNLTRADTGLPFLQTVVDESGSDRNFKPLRTEEIPIDLENIPKPTPAIDTDKTEDLAGELSVPEEKRIRGKRRKADDTKTSH